MSCEAVRGKDRKQFETKARKILRAAFQKYVYYSFNDTLWSSKMPFKFPKEKEQRKKKNQNLQDVKVKGL